MRVLIVLVALLIPVFAYAGPCGDYEYAELQDMDQKLFLEEYCKVRSTWALHGMLVVTASNRQTNSDFDSCNQTIKKMERIYLKRFKIDNLKELENQCK